jgi:O-methyltransferase involved in polyketide biosynthesis
MKYNDFRSNMSDNANKTEEAYERISPTAWLTAYQRTLSDIPLANEMYRELQEIIRQTRSPAEVQELEKLRRPETSFVWESRFKIVDRLIKEQHIDQVLEIASGYSPRGLNMSKDASVEYVEIDLPNIIEEKRRIVEKLVGRSEAPIERNLHLAEGNALESRDLFAAARFFKARPVAVVNEGLLPYLNHNEKAILGKNIHGLLERFGGAWITPDIATQTQAALFKERTAGRAARIEHLTGIDIMKNRFENEEAARLFFEGLGFSVEEHSFTEIAGELVSSPHWRLSPEQVKKIMGRLTAFVMETNAAGQRMFSRT